MASQAWKRDVYRQCPIVTEVFLMGQRSVEERPLSVHIYNLCSAFCSFHLVLSNLMHSFLSFNLDSF